MNGLTFIDRWLYLHPVFFKDVPTEHFFGKGIYPDISLTVNWKELSIESMKYEPAELFIPIVIKRS
nr:DUF4277 domain-containing protein [Methanomicrobium antiquum]